MVECISAEKIEDWIFANHSDGCHQVYKEDGSFYSIEREEQAKRHRKQWHIVERPDESGSQRWPKIICGPFPTLEAAQAAYILMTN